MSAREPRAGARDPGAAIAAIWSQYRGNALARVAVLEDAVAALLEDRLCMKDRGAAEREAHRLAGSAGTFGFPQASESARQLEWIFAGTEPVPAARRLLAADEVVALRAVLDADTPPAQEPQGTETAGSDTRGLVIAVGEVRRREQIVAAAAGRGFHPIVVSDGAQLPGGDVAPVAALVDLGFPDGAGLAMVAQLGSADPPVPTLALAPTTMFRDRLEAVRAGARGFLDAAAPPDELLKAVEALLTRSHTADATVLVLDDDAAVLGTVGAALASAGLRMVGIEDPALFWTALVDEEPDLIILDLDMPGLRGDELCRMVRSDAQWAGLPILFLTAHTDPGTVGAIFAAGADDFVAKPFGGPELLARVRNRLERTRQLRALVETDPLTGLANRRRSGPVLEQLLDLAQRHNQPFSIALLNLDRLKDVNDLHGHAVGDAVLRRLGSLLRAAFGRDDVVARWGGEEFLLGMHGMALGDGVQQITSVLETLRGEYLATPSGESISVSFSAGIAAYPDDAATVQGLCEAAGKALSRAKRRGGDRVLPVGSSRSIGDAARTVDVVVAEDDGALAELLEHALSTRGYRIHHLADGKEAADQLTGSPPALRARVVLLDVDLPVLNGFGVLRQMAASGTLAGTRVIMLTARSGEREVLEALELGAFDHVAKPFSVPVLMERIRRALGA